MTGSADCLQALSDAGYCVEDVILAMKVLSLIEPIE